MNVERKHCTYKRLVHLAIEIRIHCNLREAITDHKPCSCGCHVSHMVVTNWPMKYCNVRCVCSTSLCFPIRYVLDELFVLNSRLPFTYQDSLHLLWSSWSVLACLRTACGKPRFMLLHVCAFFSQQAPRYSSFPSEPKSVTLLGGLVYRWSIV